MRKSGLERRSRHKLGGGPGWRSNYPNQQTVKYIDKPAPAVDSWWLRPALVRDRAAFSAFADQRFVHGNNQGGLVVNSHSVLDMD